MDRIGPLKVTETWRYALLGGLLAFPVTAFEVWRSPEEISLGMVLVGSALAGYLIKRRGGNSTATGLRAGVIGGAPILWGLGELLRAIPAVPNPTWFKLVGVLMLLAVAGFFLLILAVCGAFAGRFGGWIAKRRGHDGAAETQGHVS